MTDDSSSAAEGDFMSALPPRKAVDERLTGEVSGPERGEQPLAPPAAGLDIRKRLSPAQKARRRLFYASVPVGLAVVSWFLGGDLIWGAVAAVAALLVIVASAAAFRVVAARDLRLGDFLPAGYLLLCWASWTAVGYFLPLATVHVTGQMDGEPDCPFRVSYGGQVRLAAERGRECSFQIRGRFRPDEVKVETLTTQGWIDRSFRDYGDEVDLEKIPTTRIYLDNRGNGPVELGCGPLRFTAAAGGKACFRIPALPVGARCPLTLDGQEVGNVGSRNVLVDALGTRSYTLRTVTYESGFAGLLRLGRPDLGPPPGKEAVLSGRHVHQLPGAIDFFLEPAPPNIKVTTFGGIDPIEQTRMELCETDS